MGDFWATYFSQYAFGKAILEARKEVLEDVPNMIRKQLESHLLKKEAS